MRAIVISMPKAGTYLTTNLLQCLDLKFSGIHIDPGMYRIFKNNNPKDFIQKKSSLSDAVLNVNEGCFAVGHIPFSKKNKESLSEFKKVLIVRDFEEIHQSAQRYVEEKGVGVFNIINDKNLNSISLWSNEEDVFVINFNDIIQENKVIIDSLQNYLFGSVVTDSIIAAQLAKSMDSLTKSSIR